MLPVLSRLVRARPPHIPTKPSPWYLSGIFNFSSSAGDIAAISLCDDDVRRIAQLSHLNISDAELAGARRDLENMLTMVAHVQAVARADAASASSVNYNTLSGPDSCDAALERSAEVRIAALRADVVTDGSCSDVLLACAPRTEGPYFTVPKMVDSSNTSAAHPGGRGGALAAHADAAAGNLNALKKTRSPR